jgi:hypothetical protein
VAACQQTLKKKKIVAKKIAAMPSYTSKTDASRTMGINSATSAITAPVSFPETSPETGSLRQQNPDTSLTNIQLCSESIRSHNKLRSFVSLTCIVWNGNFDQHKHPIYLTFFLPTKICFLCCEMLVNIEVLTNIGITVDVLELHYQNS